jgi:hypothetical protein
MTQVLVVLAMTWLLLAGCLAMVGLGMQFGRWHFARVLAGRWPLGAQPFLLVGLVAVKVAEWAYRVAEAIRDGADPDLGRKQLAARAAAAPKPAAPVVDVVHFEAPLPAASVRRMRQQLDWYRATPGERPRS